MRRIGFIHLENSLLSWSAVIAHSRLILVQFGPFLGIRFAVRDARFDEG